MKDTLDDSIWYAIIRNILEYETHCNMNRMDMVHIDFPALFGTITLEFFCKNSLVELYYVGMHVNNNNLSSELDWYWFQANTFQSQESPQTKGPFTMMMSRYVDGQAWFRFLLHINEQTKICKKKGYHTAPLIDSLWLTKNQTAIKWLMVRILIDIGVKDGQAGETWLYEAFNVMVFKVDLLIQNNY